jgi:hypothetical protein
MRLDESGFTFTTTKLVALYRVTLTFKDGRLAEVYFNVLENFISSGFLVLRKEKQTIMISLESLDKIQVTDMPEGKDGEQRVLPLTPTLEEGYV